MSIVKLNNRALRSATAVGTTTQLGAMVFISKQTASSSSTISFTSGIDSTYKEYLFTFKNMHPSSDGGMFSFQADTGTNTNYNQTITSTHFYATHNEGDSATALGYYGSGDQAQATGFQHLSGEIGNGGDESCSGYLHLFNPSSSTFVKHFTSNSNTLQRTDYSWNSFVAGYFNTTTALTRVQFKMVSEDNQSLGNIDAGDICLYGIN